MRFGYCNEALARQPAYKLKGRPHTNSKADRIQTQRQTAYKLKGRPHTNSKADRIQTFTPPTYSVGRSTGDGYRKMACFIIPRRGRPGAK
jgi:hypothetical protein